jgi:hypothetical protein
MNRLANLNMAYPPPMTVMIPEMLPTIALASITCGVWFADLVGSGIDVLVGALGSPCVAWF